MRAVVESMGLMQLNSREAVAALCAEVVAAAPEDVERFRAGKTRVLGHLVGSVLRASGGRANPRLVKRALEELMA